MLRLIRIRNFAIIDYLELEFSNGFNAITGETGAGKSIILNALGLVLGERATADLIRTGSEEATVEALFDITQCEQLQRRFKLEKGNANNHELLIRRTIHRSGKNKIYMNGDLITLSHLAEICSELVELCSQHEHQNLSKSSYQLELLDRYGGLIEQREELREIYSSLKSSEAELKSFNQGDSNQARTEDFLRFQIKEIEEFNPVPGEEEELKVSKKRLIHGKQLLQTLNESIGALTGDEQGSADARTLLVRTIQQLSRVADLDPEITKIAEGIERAVVEIDEAADQLTSRSEGLEISPEKLEEIESRLSEWAKIKKKYGDTAEAILKNKENIEKELNEFSHRQARIDELEKQLEFLKASYTKAAQGLSMKRFNVAKTLKSTIEGELHELMMPNTKFEIKLSETEWSADGVDKVQFLFSPNLGVDPKPIAKVASGGELSRIMLGIRRTIANKGSIGVYVFDEIDSGIGGQTASVVGKKLQSVSTHNQVICITHMAQVAAYASNHFLVSKGVTGGKTVTSIIQLEDSKRVEEIARMLSGMSVTDESRGNAKALLEQATQA